MATAEAPPKVEYADLWDLYVLNYAQELPCPDLRRFMLFLEAKSTRKAEVHYNVTKGITNVTLYGPITDEAIYDEQGKGESLTVSFLLSRDLVFQELDLEGRKRLVTLMREKGKITTTQLHAMCNALRLPRGA